MRKFVLLLFTLFIVKLMCTLINVPDMDNDIYEIQDGIDLAVDGDTVLVAPGTYYENINFLGKKITVASAYLITGDEEYIENTIIDGGGNDSVVRMESGEDTLSYLCGFVITNGCNSRGGGIRIEHSGAKLEHLKIRENQAVFTCISRGGGLYADGDAYLPGYRQLILRNIEFVENVSQGYGANYGGFSIGHQYNLLILDSVFVTNNCADGEYSASGGGGNITTVSNFYMRNCLISNNLAVAQHSASTGGISMTCINNIFIENCQIIGNTVESGYSRIGGLKIYDADEVTIRDCIIAENSSLAGGSGGDEAGCGGVSLANGNFYLEDCEIRGNIAADGCGGMGMGLNCDVILNRVIIHDNVAEKGAAISTEKADVLLINSIMCNNQSFQNGGIYSHDIGRFRVVNSIFWNNGAEEFWIDGPTCVQFQHNIIQYGEDEISCSNGGSYFWGEGNMQSSPQFVSIGTDDFHLQESSPGIDSGVNACEKWGPGPYLIPGEDIIGQNRDIGIYEQGDEDYSFDLPTYLSVNEDVILSLDLEEYLMGYSGQFSGSCENYLESMVSGNVISWQPAENWYGFDEVWVDFETAGGETFSDYILIEVLRTNDAPIIELPESVSFNNIGSYHLDVLQYITDIEGQTVTVSAAGSEHISAWISSPYLYLQAEAGWQGTETVTVFAEDDWERLLSSDTLLVEVYCEPVANCGDDIYGRDGETVSLDGSGSLDPLLNGLSYLWSTGSELQINNASSVQAEILLPEVEEVAEAVINLEVSDGFNSSTDSLLLEYWDDEPLEVECDIYPASNMIRISWSPALAAESEYFEIIGYQMYFEECEYDTLQNATDCVYMFILPAGEYRFGVQAVYSDGVSDIVTIYTTDAEINDISGVTGIISVYPNPFNPETTISFFTTEGTENTELNIYNIKGQRIREWKIENVKCKINSVVWDGNDDGGHRVGSGVYFLRFRSGSVEEVKKLVLMK